MSDLQKVIKVLAAAFAVFLGITIIGSIIAAVFAIVRGFSGKSFGEISIGGDVERISFSSEWTEEEREALNLKNIVVDCSARIYVVKGDVLSVKAEEVPETYRLETKNGTLSVKDEKSRNMINFSFFTDSLKNAVVTITVPESFPANFVEIQSGSGKVEVQGINCNRFTADSGSGSIRLENIQCNDFVLDSGSGSVTINNLTAQNSNLETGSGNMQISNSSIGSLKADSGSGRVDMEKVIAQNASVNSGSGRINYSGTLTGNCRFKSGSGAVTMKLTGKAENYSISVDCGSGGFWLDGKKRDDGTYGSNVDGKLLFDSGSGRVTVDFE